MCALSRGEASSHGCGTMYRVEPFAIIPPYLDTTARVCWTGCGRVGGAMASFGFDTGFHVRGEKVRCSLNAAE